MMMCVVVMLWCDVVLLYSMGITFVIPIGCTDLTFGGVALR